PVKQTVTQVIFNHDTENGYYIDKAGGNYIRYRNDADGNLLKFIYKKDDNNNFVQVGDAVKVAKDANGNYDFSDIIDTTKTIDKKEVESFEISG
ncbi:MAG: hypothetical protein J5497_07045, partial [Selenomonadaceae bacterium]|nr:hypothetical protein [Selenomonadaceae bacterium]